MTITRSRVSFGRTATLAATLLVVCALPASAHFTWPIGGYVTRGPAGHGYNAVDIDGGDGGEHVYSSNNGTYYAKNYDADGYGYYAMTRHGNTCGGTTYYGLYAHLQSFSSTCIGCSVTKYVYVGHMGSTGRSTGPHVHLEVRRGSTKLYINKESGWVTLRNSLPVDTPCAP